MAPPAHLGRPAPARAARAADQRDLRTVGLSTAVARPPLARGIALLAVAFVAVELAFEARYGYHRDELYFLTIGGHPAFGYVDQPPLVPLLAHGLDVLSGHSLFWLRAPSAVAGGAVVLLTGLVARELGARERAQLFAASCMAASAILVLVSHMASTSTYDLLGWTALSWLAVRALRGDEACWPWFGLVAGMALEVKTLPVFLLAGLTLGVLVAGPRRVFVSRRLWVGATIALALWAPNLVWQATHGWPQLALSSAIASGSSGTSQPRAVFVPYLFLLVSPVLAPVWLTGWWQLARSSRLRPWRAFAVAGAFLVVVFVIVDGKPYYFAGLFPVLLAAGAQPTVDWAASRARQRLLGVLVVLSAAVSAVLMLPIVPVADLHDTPIVAINYDGGETVGWPAFVRTVAGVYDRLPAAERVNAVVLAGNYGEDGAIARFRPAIPVFGVQNSDWDLGPPPAATTTVVAVGFTAGLLHRWFGSVRRVATIDNGVDVDNDEQGGGVWVGTRPTQPWAERWSTARRLG